MTQVLKDIERNEKCGSRGEEISEGVEQLMAAWGSVGWG